MKNLINRALAAEKQLLFCVTLVVAMMFTACGGGDSDNKSEKSSNPYAKVAGSWRCDYDNDFNIRTYDEFGVGTVTHFSYNGETQTGKSVFLIDERTNQLMVYDTWESSKHPSERIVYSVSESEMRIEGKKDADVYFRVK